MEIKISCGPKRNLKRKKKKMAEEVLGKTVKELKKERTTAKSSFTRQANFILRGGNNMLQDELKEFTKLNY